MAINTYILSISQGETDAITFSKYVLNKVGDADVLDVADSRLVFSDELADMNNWNVDMAFSITDETLLQYKASSVKKAVLREVADVFRGKAVSSKDEFGNIAVVNISNINETGIDYNNLDTINDEERKVSRYLLEEGDVLITTKGFAIKVAVYEKQPRMVIASSNLCVIRPNSKIINGTYLKLFLESDTGMKLIKSLQRGTTIVNVNYQDLCEIEVPVPPLDEQYDIANEYNKGLSLYKKTIAAAEDAWKVVKNSVKSRLF
jgi:restriction endonuclease S subunit